jgi:hypothetical protein
MTAGYSHSSRELRELSSALLSKGAKLRLTDASDARRTLRLRSDRARGKAVNARQRSVLVVSRSRDIIRSFFAGYTYHVTATGPDGFQVGVTSRHSSINDLIGNFPTLAAAELFAARMRKLDLGDTFISLPLEYGY